MLVKASVTKPNEPGQSLDQVLKNYTVNLVFTCVTLFCFIMVDALANYSYFTETSTGIDEGKMLRKMI